ncbi:MAG: FtsX-like permease family protein [Hyphomicrobiaceae bacterium]
MVPRLAYRNLFHDKLSLAVTLVGILFSVLLVAVQCGLYIGSSNRIASVIDRSQADLWIVPFATKSFDDASPLPGREKYPALSTDGVASVHELVVGFASWRKPQGGRSAILLVGTDWNRGGFAPWNLVEGSLVELTQPGAVAIDKSYFADLGIAEKGGWAEINGQRVTVEAVTRGIRSFTTLPYVFTTTQRARELLNYTGDRATFTLVKLKPGADIAQVRDQLQTRLKDTEVLTHDEFRTRSLNYWLFKTGAGAALIAGAVLGLIVGVVVVAQTLYASTKDHLNEFATLRALGASANYIHWVILLQALMSAVIGYLLGLGLALIVIWLTQNTTLLIVMTPALAAMLFALTLGMCTIAAVSAIFKVTRIDPASVFSR